MDLDRLISRLTTEIFRHLQDEDQGPKHLILAPRASAATLILPAELAAGRLFYADDADRPTQVARRILPRLTIAQQAGLAQGQTIDPLSQLVFAEILAGHQVEVLAFEYHCYRQTAPAALYRLFEDQAKQLALFGIRPYRPDTIAEDPTTTREKRLLTERDIKAIVASGASRYRLARGCRLTPLAADCARDNHLLLERD